MGTSSSAPNLGLGWARVVALALLVMPNACGGRARDEGVAAGAGGMQNAAGGASGQASGGALDGGACFDRNVAINQAQRAQLLSSACHVFRSEFPRTLEIVIDVSLDSAEPDPNQPTQSRWDATRDALLTLVNRDDEAGLPESVAVGLRFPSIQAEGPAGPACGSALRVPIARLGSASSPQRTQLAQALLEFRPRAASLRDLYAETVRELLAATPWVSRPQVLLVTDGARDLGANCGALPSDRDALLDDVLAAARESTQTFVLGTPGSDGNSDWLAALATRGSATLRCAEPSAACYFAVTEQPELGRELTSAIFGNPDFAAECGDIPLPSDVPGLKPEQTVVLFTWAGQTSLVQRSCSQNCSTGWLQAPDMSLRLCPLTCELAHPNVRAVLEVVYGCAP